MYVCLTVALCDCVHGKGQHQLGQGEWSFKEVPFSRMHEQTWLAIYQAANFAVGHKGWAEKPGRGIAGPFQAL